MYRTASLCKFFFLCWLLIGICLLSQCNCKNQDQKQNKRSNLQKEIYKDQPENNKVNNPTLAPESPLSHLPIPDPTKVGPVLENITPRELLAMESIHYMNGGSPAFLVSMLRDIKQDPTKVNIKAQDKLHEGATILHAAVNYAAMKTKDIIQDLRKLGADINALDDKGQTPLHYAITNRPYLVETLLELGAKIDIADANGNTPLHLAVKPGKAKYLETLLEKVTLAQLDQPNANGHSPLHVAVLAGNVEAVQALINKGANMNLATPDGKNALHLAASRGQLAIVKALIDKGADQKSKTADNKTAVDFAQDKEVIEYLGGVWNPPSAITHDILDILQVAVDGVRHEFLANKLRNPGQDINETDPTRLNTTALHQAAEVGNNDAVKILLAHGAAIDLADDQGKTALHKAAQAGHLEIVKTLLAHGAIINLSDHNGWPPLIWAGLAGNLDVVKLLVDYGADINFKATDGRTLLYSAAESNNIPLIAYLIDKKVLVNFRSCRTQTPLYIAVAKKRERAVELLIQAGANPNLGMVGYGDHAAPLPIAVSQGNEHVVAMLLDAGAQVKQENIDKAPTEQIKQLLQARLPKDH